MFIKSLIKKSINRLLPSFSPDFTSNSQIRPVFYAEKWFFLKKLGNLFKEWFKHSKEFITFFEEIFLAKAKQLCLQRVYLSARKRDGPSGRHPGL